VPEPDDFIDADAAAANRRDVVRATIITAVGLATVVIASLLVVVSGISS
jgi:hypothetical protein